MKSTTKIYNSSFNFKLILVLISSQSLLCGFAANAGNIGKIGLSPAAMERIRANIKPGLPEGTVPGTARDYVVGTESTITKAPAKVAPTSANDRKLTADKIGKVETATQQQIKDFTKAPEKIIPAEKVVHEQPKNLSQKLDVVENRILGGMQAEHAPSVSEKVVAPTKVVPTTANDIALTADKIGKVETATQQQVKDFTKAPEKIIPAEKPVLEQPKNLSQKLDVVENRILGGMQAESGHVATQLTADGKPLNKVETSTGLISQPINPIESQLKDNIGRTVESQVSKQLEEQVNKQIEEHVSEQVKEHVTEEIKY